MVPPHVWQVNKSHLLKMQEQRITEEDLAFDGMEPDCSAIMAFGSTAGRMVSLLRLSAATSDVGTHGCAFCFLEENVDPCCVTW